MASDGLPPEWRGASLVRCRFKIKISPTKNRLLGGMNVRESAGVKWGELWIKDPRIMIVIRRIASFA